MAEHVQQIRNKTNDAHLFLQQPASQPREVLDELLIAQAVLHCSGYVTHPNGCRSACCTSGTDQHPLPQAIRLSEATDRCIDVGLDDGGASLLEETA